MLKPQTGTPRSQHQPISDHAYAEFLVQFGDGRNYSSDNDVNYLCVVAYGFKVIHSEHGEAC